MIFILPSCPEEIEIVVSFGKFCLLLWVLFACLFVFMGVCKSKNVDSINFQNTRMYWSMLNFLQQVAKMMTPMCNFVTMPKFLQTKLLSNIAGRFNV